MWLIQCWANWGFVSFGLGYFVLRVFWLWVFRDLAYLGLGGLRVDYFRYGFYWEESLYIMYGRPSHFCLWQNEFHIWKITRFLVINTTNLQARNVFFWCLSTRFIFFLFFRLNGSQTRITCSDFLGFSLFKDCNAGKAFFRSSDITILLQLT